MPSHPWLAAGCFATGALAAAFALICIDRADTLAFSLKVAWLRLGRQRRRRARFCPACDRAL